MEESLRVIKSIDYLDLLIGNVQVRVFVIMLKKSVISLINKELSVFTHDMKG